MEKAIVGITLGDASGIGPEIVAKLCVKGYFTQYFRPIMIGDVRVFEDGLRIIGAEYPHYVIKDVDEADWSKGQPVLDLGDQDPALVTMVKRALTAASVMWIRLSRPASSARKERLSVSCMRRSTKAT